MKSNNYTVAIERYGPSIESWKNLETELPKHEKIKELLNDTKHRLLSIKLLSDPKIEKKISSNDNFQFRATFYDYTNNITILADGSFNNPEELTLTKSSTQPLPSFEEYSEALEILKSDPEIGKMINEKIYRPYRAMPGISSNEMSDGRTDRLIMLGLYPIDKTKHNEIIGIDLLNKTVVRADETFDAHSDSLESMMFQFQKNDFLFPRFSVYENNSQHCYVIVKDNGGNEMWRMLVFRPSSSSGLNGSGLDIKFINYKGKRVLYQAHMPILNVLYDNNVQEYRDWQTQEAGFDAVGSLFKDTNGHDIDGFMNCSKQPTTIFDTGKEGSFYGIAVYIAPDNSLSLTTMMQAGWYRYFNSYTFSPDGTIKPRVGFTTSGSNPYAGVKHHHHAYFRFDFDIKNQFWNNNIIEETRSFQFFPNIHINTTDTILLFETKKYRSNFSFLTGPTTWKVMDGSNSTGYAIYPGAVDGTAKGDNYAQGDLWFLKYHGDELDDGVPQLSKPSQAKIDKFLNNESVHNSDVVVWYAVHFLHDPAQTKGENDFGPTFAPINW